jgi:uncharacterized protein (TIRG00374 family)
MKITLKRFLKYVLLLGLAAVLLWLAFRKVDWGEFWTILGDCNYWWILATMVLQAVITLMRGNRWRIMMRPLSKEISRHESYDAYAVCYLANMALPRSGEVVRCGMIASTGKATFEGTLGTVVIERTWDLLCIVLAVLPLFFVGRFRDFLVEKMFAPAAESMHFSWFWLGVIVLAVLVALFFVLRAFRHKIAETKAGAALIRFWKGLVEGFKAGFRMERKWAFFGYTLLIWVSYWLCCLWTIYAFPGTESLTGLDALFLMVVGSLGWVVPVQGGFGAYHFLVTMTLVPIYGFAESTGLAFATISHESQIVQMLVCGLAAWASWAICHRKNKKQPTQQI